MKFILFLVIVTQGITGYSQDYDAVYNKCLKAVINIEVRSHDQKVNTQINELHQKKLISDDRWHELQDSIKNARAKSGTAIFFKDSGKHFLITARHVVIDEYIKKPADSNILASSIMLIENDTILNPPIQADYRNVRENYVERMLWMYNPYPNEYHKKPYILSSIQDDIAILCIDCDSMSTKFCNTLIQRGYVPLETKDLDTLFRIKKGSDLYAIGFPGNSIVAGLRYPGHIYSQLRTSIISVPVLTLGVFIDEYPKKSNFFDARMFVYKGFSGGPVMSKGKLVGLVSGGEIAEKKITGEKTPFRYLIHNHSKFVKSSTIYSMLKILRQKLKTIPPQKPRIQKN